MNFLKFSFFLAVSIFASACCTQKCCEEKFPCVTGNCKHLYVVAAVGNKQCDAMKVGTDVLLTGIPYDGSQDDEGEIILVTIDAAGLPVSSKLWCEPDNDHCYKDGGSNHNKLHYRGMASVNGQDTTTSYLGKEFSLVILIDLGTGTPDTVWMESSRRPQLDSDVYPHYIEADDTSYYLKGYKIAFDFDDENHMH